MKLVISLDVEEEGLFSGKYPRIAPGVANVSHLRRLEFIPREFGFPLTLLATWPVVRDQEASATLRYWREKHGAEIGVHLHHWNTPPFSEIPLVEPVRSDVLPVELLDAKLGRLVAEVKERIGVVPRSFRMGRFDLGKNIREMLPGHGLMVDSSIVPLRTQPNGPDHFLCPPDPYLLPVRGEAPVLEAPLTMVPFFRKMPALLERAASCLSGGKRERFLSNARLLTATGIHPAWYPLPSMLLAAKLHRTRGGGVLTMFLHSSELAPGATPDFPTENAVDRLVSRLRAFLWRLVRTQPVQGATLSDLYREL